MNMDSELTPEESSITTAGPSGVETAKTKTEFIKVQVDVKPEFTNNKMDMDSDPEQDENDDHNDSDFEIKEEIKNTNSLDSEEEENNIEDGMEENECSNILDDGNQEKNAKYQSFTIKSYTSVIVKEEPLENVKNIFKDSLLEYEKQKYHQQIFEQILENSGKLNKLKDIQAQYIAQLREAAGIEIFTCSLCNYETINLANLNCHFLTNHNGRKEHRIHKCNKCNFETVSVTTIKKHVYKSHQKISKKVNKGIKTKNERKEKYPCNECSYQGRTEDGLLRHVKTTHKTNKSKCDLCSFESEDKNTLKDHKNTHKKGGDFYCYKCSYRNGSKLTLALHLLREHKIDNEMSKRSKICEICSLPCTSITKLKRHYLSHVDLTELDESQIWKCPEPGCTYQSKTKNNLNLHIRTHKAPEFMCEICGFATKRKESYKWHLETHKKLSEIDWIPCPICPYQARTKRHMYQHMKIGVHDGKNRRHIRKRNLQAEGIPVPESSVYRIKNIYIEATTDPANRKPKRKRKPRTKKKPQETPASHLPPNSLLPDPILNFEELARAIVKNEVN